MLWKNPKRLHFLVVAILCIGGTVAIWWLLSNHQQTWKHWLGSCFLAVNVVTFAWYGLDKILASRLLMMWWRVPEVVLHTLSAVGGSPAALAAMMIFRHK